MFVAASALLSTAAPPSGHRLHLIDAESAAEMEARLAADPDNAEAHSLLFVWYARQKDPERMKPHAWWVARNAPATRESVQASNALAETFPDAEEQLRRLWDEHVRRAPDSARVLSSALEFWLSRSCLRSETLMQLRRPLWPGNRADALGWLYSQSILSQFGLAQSRLPSDGPTLGAKVQPLLLTSPDLMVVRDVASSLGNWLLRPDWWPAGKKAPLELYEYEFALIDRARKDPEGRYLNLLRKQLEQAAKTAARE